MRNLQNAIKKVTSFKGLLSETIIVRTAKQTYNQYNRGWIKCKTTDEVEAIEALGLETFLESPLVGRKLDATLTAKGIEFLNRIVFTSKGKQRRTRDAQALGDREIVILQNFSFFTFDGFHDDGHGNLIPAWRVHSNNQLDSFVYTYTGGRFSYAGGLEIVG